MKRLLSILYLVFLFSIGATSCSKEQIPEPLPKKVDQTVFMYLPWSGNERTLTTDFYRNIKDFETAIAGMNLRHQRVLTFICDPAEKAILYELKGSGGKKERTVLKRYNNPAYTTAEGITSILEDVKRFAPADNYAMTIGCHGMGWIPLTPETMRRAKTEKLHWEYDGEVATRYFGGTQREYQTDVTTLAEGIAGAEINMQYILFDDCYMSTIEVAYDLKDVADHIIACPTEIMAKGMPYANIGRYLIGDVDYDRICEEFHKYYSNNGTYSCGTIGVTATSELGALATIMKSINLHFSISPSLIKTIQKMDGYNPAIFFDMGDYVSKLCTDTDLLKGFMAQLELTVPYRKNTPYYYSMESGFVEIKTFSGVTISDPSTNTMAAPKTGTAWYKATH